MVKKKAPVKKKIPVKKKTILGKKKQTGGECSYCKSVNNMHHTSECMINKANTKMRADLLSMSTEEQLLSEFERDVEIKFKKANFDKDLFYSQINIIVDYFSDKIQEEDKNILKEKIEFLILKKYHDKINDLKNNPSGLVIIHNYFNPNKIGSYTSNRNNIIKAMKILKLLNEESYSNQTFNIETIWTEITKRYIVLETKYGASFKGRGDLSNENILECERLLVDPQHELRQKYEAILDKIIRIRKDVKVKLREFIEDSAPFEIDETEKQKVFTELMNDKDMRMEDIQEIYDNLIEETKKKLKNMPLNEFKNLFNSYVVKIREKYPDNKDKQYKFFLTLGSQNIISNSTAKNRRNLFHKIRAEFQKEYEKKQVSKSQKREKLIRQIIDSYDIGILYNCLNIDSSSVILSDVNKASRILDSLLQNPDDIPNNIQDYTKIKSDLIIQYKERINANRKTEAAHYNERNEFDSNRFNINEIKPHLVAVMGYPIKELSLAEICANLIYEFTRMIPEALGITLGESLSGDIFEPLYNNFQYTLESFKILAVLYFEYPNFFKTRKVDQHKDWTLRGKTSRKNQYNRPLKDKTYEQIISGYLFPGFYKKNNRKNVITNNAQREYKALEQQLLKARTIAADKTDQLLTEVREYGENCPSNKMSEFKRSVTAYKNLILSEKHIQNKLKQKEQCTRGVGNGYLRTIEENFENYGDYFKSINKSRILKFSTLSSDYIEEDNNEKIVCSFSSALYRLMKAIDKFKQREHTAHIDLQKEFTKSHRVLTNDTRFKKILEALNLKLNDKILFDETSIIHILGIRIDYTIFKEKMLQFQHYMQGGVVFDDFNGIQIKSK